MNNILVFGASSSKKSINKQLAEFAAISSGFNYNLIDLNDYEMPIFSVDKEAENGIPEKAFEFKNLVKEADGIIISFAEHNGSYSSAFKNIMDWASRIEKSRWNNKTMFLMATSPGKRGGTNVLNHALGYFPYMDANVVASFSLPSFNDNFVNKTIKHQEYLDAFIIELAKFKQAISEQ